MIQGIGIDIVEIDRVRRVLSDSFLRKILSGEEFERASLMSEKRKIEFAAGRFAVKEAIIKALSDYEVPLLKDLNITNNEKGKPEIVYKNYRLLISIAHESSYAVGQALLLGVNSEE